MKFLIRIYDRCMGWTVPLQSFFLLLLRIIWGSQLIFLGLDKLKNIPATIEYFQSLGIPQPQNVAWTVGFIEAICGGLLVLGLLSRLAAFPLVVVLCAAYITAHQEALLSLFSNFDLFTQQAPFLFLFSSLVILCFGPGKVSVDHLVRSKAS